MVIIPSKYVNLITEQESLVVLVDDSRKETG